MGDVIYEKNQSYKPDVLIPKLNGLSMIKTGSDSDLKEAPVRKNGYVHHSEVKISRSGSQIKFINAAVYIEKDTTPKNYSRGDGMYKQNEDSFLKLDSIKIGKQLINKTLDEKPPNHINGIVRNGAGDRLCSLIKWTKVCEPSEILCDEAKTNDEDLNENLPAASTTSKDSQTSSFCSIEESSVVSCSEDDSRNDRYVENPPIDEERHLSINEKIKKPVKSLQRLFYRSYSDIDRGKALSAVVTNNVVASNLNPPCSIAAVQRRCSVRLSDSSYISTFPERNIRKKILNALAEKGDVHYVTIECKSLLPHNWENLIAFEDLAWFRWYISKLEQEKQRKEAKRNIDLRKRDDDEIEREQRLCKEKKEKEKIQAWKERKAKEYAARKERDRKLELEKQKADERARIEKKMAKRARAEWNKKKDSERKEQKLKEEKIKMQMEEEKKLRDLKNQEAYETWKEKTKNRPKPMSIAIKDHKGRSDPILARLNWNPIPWRNMLDESKVNVPKDPGKRRILIKPCST